MNLHWHVIITSRPQFTLWCCISSVINAFSALFLLCLLLGNFLSFWFFVGHFVHVHWKWAGINQTSPHSLWIRAEVCAVLPLQYQPPITLDAVAPVPSVCYHFRQDANEDTKVTHPRRRICWSVCSNNTVLWHPYAKATLHYSSQSGGYDSHWLCVQPPDISHWFLFENNSRAFYL